MPYVIIYKPLIKQIEERLEELKLPDEIRSGMEIQLFAEQVQKSSLEKVEHLKEMQRKHIEKYGNLWEKIKTKF